MYENYQELLLFEYFEFECLLIKLYKYECCTITGIWKQGSTYFVVKPIKYGLVLTFSPVNSLNYSNNYHRCRKLSNCCHSTYIDSKSGDSDVLSLTFNLFESFSKIILF